MIVNLTRAFRSPAVTLGMIQIDGISHVPIYTLELPWKDNTPNVSCIPEGTYVGRKYTSPRFSHVWEITGVERRSHILIHTGNTVDDVGGCILVGRTSGHLNGKPAVLESRRAIHILRQLLDDDFRMVVK